MFQSILSKSIIFKSGVSMNFRMLVLGASSIIIRLDNPGPRTAELELRVSLICWRRCANFCSLCPFSNT